MSIEATLDLLVSNNPRSLCVFPTSEIRRGNTGATKNPFESDETDEIEAPLAMVVGTERKSLHYRTFAPVNQWKNSSSKNNAGQSPTEPVQQPLKPLGSSNDSPARGWCNPVDLGSLAGPIMACILLDDPSHPSSLRSRSSSSLSFLLLVDDNRGTSGPQPGAFSPAIATLANGMFHLVVPMGGKSLPRMSCATFHQRTGLVYGAGRSIHVLDSSVWEQTAKSGRYPARRKRLSFGKNVLPAPGVRSGQDSLAVTANGKVVVAIVGNCFYAISAVEEESDGDYGDSNQQQQHQAEVIKLVSFTQTSQVHPVIAHEIHDESLDQFWFSLFLGSGRDCAVVDLHYGPSSAPVMSCSAPRHGTTTLSSPILAAATSWPYVAVLTSDGLVSIRSPSCLAIALRTVRPCCV